MDVQEMFDEFTAHGFEDVEDARKLAVLNETYQDFCARMPWPFLERVRELTFNGVSGVSSNMPTDFRAALKLMGPNYRWVPMRDDDVLERRTSTGMRYVYHFRAGALTVDPTPTSDQVATLLYIMYPEDLTDDSLEAEIVVPPRYHRSVLVNGSLYKLYALEDDTDLSATFERLYEKAIERGKNDLWRQQYDAPDYIHQTDWEDYDY
jgi:hypothetical protein